MTSPVDDKMIFSQGCGLAAKAALDVLSCISKAEASRLREVIFSLNAALVGLNQEYCVHFRAPQCRKTVEQWSKSRKEYTRYPG